MPMGGAVVMGGLALASQMQGSAAAQDQADAATKARNDAVQRWIAVNVPDPKQQQIELENYQVTGQLSPQLESAFQQSTTGLSGLQYSKSGEDAQLAALGKMSDLAQNGGLDAQSEQQLTQAENQANANEQGQRNAIVQNAMARGQGQGGGAMLAAELQASQGDANQAAASGQSAAAAAEMRALQAMSNTGAMGAQLNSQDYAQAAAAAEAQDAINRFNTQNSQNVANANVTNANAAQAANLANAQSVANANTGVANQQETFNKGLTQQQFNNEATKAAGVTGQYAGVADQANKNAQNTANMWGGISQGLAQGAGALAQYNSRPTKVSTDGSDSGSGLSSSGGGVTGGGGNSDTQSGGSDFVGPMQPEAAGGEIQPSKPKLSFEDLVAMARHLKGAQHAAA